MDHVSPSPDTIFAQAIEIESPEDRSAFLKQSCQGNAQLLGEVKKLVQDHFRAGDFLERPAFDRHQTSAYSPVSETAGTQIGPYKLLQQIGEGGMGVVYMAEQQKPVRRRVALKIIKPGMDSRQVIARFEAERQALAMMEHPNIARVLDAGCTESGRPYFAMELVQGIPITQYCDDKQLSPPERLELFIEVCHAVQHAHQKGIIHRDLKPSNVLIAIYDGKPIPKIIDFGVAKALHQQLTEKTMFTQFGAVVGTLEYMSPEQADMDLVGTDTRTDVYSLGVLLYELLTGSTPLDGKKLRALGYAEMIKTIREVDPPKPSTRLSQSAHDLANISSKRHTEPRRLQKLVAGDLDWIVMKCLEKDRTRRYETANGLALDIQRHLHDEAVSASPPGQLYKLQKMVRRNKLACTAAACVILALVLGLATSLWQAGRAEREATRATSALNDLQAAAPSIAAEARTLAAQEKFDEAIGKLEYAAKLRPDAPEYLLAKADLLESQMRLTDAVAVYRAALKLDPENAHAKENAELCEQLAAAAKTTEGKFTTQSLSRLNTQMLKDQRPAAEIMPVARILGDDKKLLVDYWLGRLKDLPVGTEKPLKERLTLSGEGLLNLNLSDTKVGDLSPLAGMPLGELNLTNCTSAIDLAPLRGMPLVRLVLDNALVTSVEPLRGMKSLDTLQLYATPVTDLSPLEGLQIHHLNLNSCRVSSLAPLRGMPLEELNISATNITDLSPLTGMPLKTFSAKFTSVQDFTPLSGLPLEICWLDNTDVRDLGFLKGTPLKQLFLSGCNKIRNRAVLSEIPTLEVLLMPPIPSDIPVQEFEAIEALRRHPSLRQFTLWVTTASTPANLKSTDEFWKNWDGDYAWALRLRKAGFTLSWGKLDDGTSRLSLRNKSFSDLSLLTGAAISHLDLNGSNVRDLAPLKSMPLTWLELDNTPAADLTPLRGLKLEYLGLVATQVRDLSPLRGMPLTRLDIRNSQITDLSPLAETSTLKSLSLPAKATNLEPLRKLTSLTELSFSYPALCTAEAFWKTWDGLPWARKLEAAEIDFSIEQSQDGYYDVTVHGPKFTDCSIFTGSNIRRLTLYRTGVVDLRPLAELPLVSLEVNETTVKDLSVLRSPVLSNSLRALRVSATDSVADFSPVAACTDLESLDLFNTALADLSILKGMKLHALVVGRTAVSDLTILAGMPLEGIYLAETKVTDIAPLLKCPTLKSIILPPDARDVTSLRALPNLERIAFSGNSTVADLTADQFWTKIKEEPWLDALRTAGINPGTPKKLNDGTWDLNLGNSAIRDLTPLKGAPISRLSLGHTAVTDLAPLRGMKLKRLALNETQVTDLEPLRGMPLEELFLSNTKVVDLSPLRGMPLKSLNLRSCVSLTDVSPLAECKSLKTLILPTAAKEIEFLRTFPNLESISYKGGLAGSAPQNAKEFWDEYDRAKNAAAPQPSQIAPQVPSVPDR